VGAIKRTTADKHFSDCVRIAANWTCQRCEKEYPEGHRQGLHCSHYVGRGNQATRYEPLNAISLCYGCHQKMGSDPHAHTELIREIIGEEDFHILLERKNVIVRKADRPIKEIAKHYREQYKIMDDKRKAGEIGPLSFEGWL